MAVIVLGLAVAGTVLVVRRPSGGTPAGAARAGQAAVPVQVITAKSGPIRTVLTYSGAIQASQQVSIAPRASGQLASVKVGVGATVRAGDPVATLDPGVLAALVQQANANLLSAQAKLALILAGPRASDVAAAQAQLDAAQAKLQQLMNPSLVDISAAENAIAQAQGTFDAAVRAVDTTYGSLRSSVNTYCTLPGETWVLLPAAPCGEGAIPLSAAVIDRISSVLGPPYYLQATYTTAAIALLTSNAAYVNAQQATNQARAALDSAKAKREALRSPLPADIAAQRSAVEVALSNLESKRTPYTDSDIQAARAAVSQAQASLAVAQANLDQTVIVAPFDGVIAQKLLDVGATVSPQTPVFTLVGKAVELHLSVDEARVGQIRPDLDAELTVPAYPGKTFRAKVATVAPTGDARAHTFDVKVFAEDPGAQLKPGMFAQVGVITVQKPDAILVPNAAVVQQTRGSVVFAIANGRASMRQVKIGVSDENNSEILDGIVAGEQVVVVGQNVLRDGQATLVATPQSGGGAGSGQPAASPQPAQGAGGAKATPSASASPAGGGSPDRRPTASATP